MRATPHNAKNYPNGGLPSSGQASSSRQAKDPKDFGDDGPGRMDAIRNELQKKGEGFGGVGTLLNSISQNSFGECYLEHSAFGEG